MKTKETQKEFMITYWSTEKRRDMGESDIYTPTGTTEEEIINEAKKLYSRDNFAAVEVINTELDEDYGDNVVFHISNDVPKGERY